MRLDRPTFDDGRAQEHVVVAPHEIQHLVLQFLRFHLPVRDADLHVGNEPVQDVVDGREFFHLVVQEEDLAAPVEFVADDALDFLLVEQDDFRLDWNPVRRRRADDAEVAGAQE